MYKPFCAFYSRIHFALFFLRKQFLVSSIFFNLNYWLMFSSTILLNYIFSIKTRISIDSSSLNIFSSSLLDLLKIIERTNVFSKMYDILGFLNFLYLLKIMQYILFSYWKYFTIILSFFSILFRENTFV